MSIRIRPGRGAVALLALVVGVPAGSGQGAAPAGEARETLYVEGKGIFDANGVPFVARGVNLQYGDNPEEKLASIPLLDQVHCNLVRLQLRADTTAAQLRSALDAIVANRMIAMPMMWEHHITGGRDPEALAEAVELWAVRHAAVLNDPAYQKYLLLNIANEWGHDLDVWEKAYEEAIIGIRDAGIRVPLVIDAADWGHDPTTFGDGRGQRLLEADPLRQLVFSVHGYFEWASEDEVNRNFDELLETGLAVMVGEFGALDHLSGGRPADHWAIMARAQAEGMGWVAWSWRGNGEGQTMLDMSGSYTEVDLTQRGRDIVHGPGGLLETSKRASYWPDY